MRRNMMALAMGLAGVAGGVVPMAAASAAPNRVKVGKPVQFAGAATVAQAPTLVRPSSKADFSRVRRVVIPYFQLEVQSQGGREASSRIFGSTARNTVVVKYKIAGVDAAAMQALADQLYADLAASFRARGIEVMDRADARTRSAAYAKIEASYQQGPLERPIDGGGKSTFYSPAGMGLYFVGIESVDTGSVPGIGRIGGMFGGIGRMATGLSQAGSAMDQYNAMQQLDAAIVGVRMKVVFVESDSFRLNGFVNVSHRATIAIQPADTQMWVIAPPSMMAKNANVRVEYQLTSALVPATDAIVSVTDTQSTGSKVGEAAGNVIGGLLGGGSSSVAEYTVTLDPQAFAGTMRETMGATQTMLIDRFRVAP